MSELVGKDLHDQGTRYVTAHLGDFDVLSSAVLAVRGAVTSAVAPLPADFDPARLTNLDFSQLLTSLKASIAWLVPEIHKSNPDGSRFIVLVENAWFKPADLRDDDRKWYFPLAEDCLVYALPGDQLTERALDDLLRLCGFFITGFVVDTAGLPNSSAGGLSARDVAKHVKQVFIAAFDRDGLILSDWS